MQRPQDACFASSVKQTEITGIPSKATKTNLALPSEESLPLLLQPSRTESLGKKLRFASLLKPSMPSLVFGLRELRRLQSAESLLASLLSRAITPA